MLYTTRTPGTSVFDYMHILIEWTRLPIPCSTLMTTFLSILVCVMGIDSLVACMVQVAYCSWTTPQTRSMWQPPPSSSPRMPSISQAPGGLSTAEEGNSLQETCTVLLDSRYTKPSLQSLCTSIISLLKVLSSLFTQEAIFILFTDLILLQSLGNLKSSPITQWNCIRWFAYNINIFPNQEFWYLMVSSPLSLDLHWLERQVSRISHIIGYSLAHWLPATFFLHVAYKCFRWTT